MRDNVILEIDYMSHGTTSAHELLSAVYNGILAVMQARLAQRAIDGHRTGILLSAQANCENEMKTACSAWDFVSYRNASIQYWIDMPPIYYNQKGTVYRGTFGGIDVYQQSEN